MTRGRRDDRPHGDRRDDRRPPDRPAGGNQPQPSRLEIVRLWTIRTDEGLYEVNVLVRASQGNRTRSERVQLVVNNILRNDAAAQGDTDIRDGQAILTTVIDPSPGVDGPMIEIGVRIPTTNIATVPIRLNFATGLPVEEKPAKQAKTVTATASPEKSNLHHVPVALLDLDGNPTSGIARAVIGPTATPHPVGPEGLVLAYNVPNGESLTVTFECPGATPATVTLHGKDKTATTRPAKVQLAALETTWHEATGASSTIIAPRAYDADGNGVGCRLYFSAQKPITIIVYDEGVEPVTHGGLRSVQIIVEEDPTSSYEFINEHGEPVAVNCDVVGLEGAIDNMVLPAAEPRPGEWCADMTPTEKRRYYRLGGR